MFLQQWDREKYQNIGNMLYNTYVQALDILELELPTFKADLEALGLTENDINRYSEEETQHVRTLGTETPGDLHAIAYVEMLQKYRAIE